ncbi:MAG: hypothetical protein HY721_06245 [Planctomycetes bacterium]|nr:hypothetical protein [Planctomycetota bacterium]
MLAGVLLAGCGSPGSIHSSYAALKPASVAVLPVRNETVHQLEQVAFGGLLQRLVAGPETYDVPGLLRAGLEEGLERRGYRLERAPAPEGARPDDSRPLPEGAPRPPSEAVLLATIESWDAATAGAFSMRMTYRIDLRRVPAGDLLYSGTFVCEEREDARSRGSGDVHGAIRRSALRALASLPRADG